MDDGFFALLAFAAGVVAMAQASRANAQVKKLSAQLVALRTELNLPPIDPDPRDAKGWKIQ